MTTELPANEAQKRVFSFLLSLTLRKWFQCLVAGMCRPKDCLQTKRRNEKWALCEKMASSDEICAMGIKRYGMRVGGDGGRLLRFGGGRGEGGKARTRGVEENGMQGEKLRG